MLAFEVEYLLGRSFAGSFRARDEGEWPPHPSRFFSALVAASHAHSAPAGAREALQWLERQAPPSIHAPGAKEGAPVSAFVPTNYFTPKGRSKQARSFPSVFPEGAKIYFVWPDAEPDAQTRRRLAGLAESVGYLGRSPSLVRVALCDQPLSPTHVPDEAGDVSFRIPAAGRLQELNETFQAGLRPAVGAHHRYRETQTIPDVPQSVFGEMIVRRRIAGEPMPLAGALLVTSQLRDALMSVAGSHNLLCPAIHGHQEADPHVAYVALPFAGSAHADGHILGIGIVVPRELDTEQKKRVRAAAMLLDRLDLPVGSWTLGIDGEDWPANLRARTWTGPERTWVTATPVLLDRFPKKNLPVEQIVAASCRRIGLPDPVEIQHGLYPMMAGVPPVPEFRLQRKGKERAEWGVHVKLTFAVPVRGPILLGRGRFFGMGLFRPVWTGRPEAQP